jgi:prepilin-type N-terminal cleavage/methylation domain-containing protein
MMRSNLQRPASKRTTPKRSAAFTLTEVMVSLAILGIVSAFLMEMLARQTTTYQVVDQVAEAQTNLRVITDLVERELRVTGFMVPESGAVCAVDNTNAPDIVVVTDAAAINPNAQTQNQLGADITGGYTGTNIDSLTFAGNGTVDANPFYDTDGNGVQDSDFVDVPGLGQTGGIIIADLNNPGRGNSCGMILANSLNLGATSSQVRIDYDFGLPGTGSTPLRALAGGDNPPQLVAIPATVYMINAANQLTRNGVILAEDVEDMQVAMFFDLDDDGVVDNDPQAAPAVPPFTSNTEYPGSILGGTQYLSGSWDHSAIREIRLSVVIRTRAQDEAARANPNLANSTFIAMENRVAPAQPADGFRRRVLTMTVKPRNIGLR